VVNSPDNSAESLDDEKLMRHLLIDTQRLAEELSLLEQVRSALPREMELGVIIRTVVEATAHTFGYAPVSLYLLEHETLMLQHQVGFPQPIERVPIGAGVNGRVARTGQPALITDANADPDFIAAMEGIVSKVCVPLFDEGMVVGTLNVEQTLQLLDEAWPELDLAPVPARSATTPEVA